MNPKCVRLASHSLNSSAWEVARAGKDSSCAEIVDLVDGESRLPRPATAVMFSFDPIPWIEKLRVPTYFLWGGRDSYAPVQLSEKLIRAALERAGNSNVNTRLSRHCARVVGNHGRLRHCICHKNVSLQCGLFPRFRCVARRGCCKKVNG